ncbi:DUF6731 family protein [Halalkalibacterium halodurans]|uniref:Uncharacterized protein n=1 Tax=Halalkalibacterium halodurans TaxID=86665 RepID=A0A0M0KIB0_ALKHA|nr:DUF6731 family protein [Halalkalibacterium halodurans]TPE65925.1 hypothetical protein AMD02_019875 [Halalkalibacterium halodurans]
MAKSKLVGFNFFRPKCTNEKGKITNINLVPLFEELRKRYQKGKETATDVTKKTEYKIVYNYNGEPVRLSNIELDVNSQYYHLLFERLHYDLPNKTTLHGESEVLDLSKEEYIGHEVSVLYDPYTHVLMIQRNRNSLGPSAIEQIFKALLSEAGTTNNFVMPMISDKGAKKRAFKQSAYRKIQMKVVGAQANGIVEKLTGKKAEGLDFVEIQFSTSPARIDSLDQEFSKEILQRYSEKDEVKKLSIRARENDDSPVEPIDLIDHKLQAYTHMKLDPKRKLNPFAVFANMVKIYNDSEHGGFKNKIIRMS